MSQTYRDTARRHPAQQQGLLSRGLAGLSKLAFWLFAAWLFSILAEWVGMWLWWPEEGVNHSRWMLEREIGYVHRDFAQSLLVEQPAAYVRTFAEVSYHYLFQVTGIERFGLWLHQPPDPEGYRVQMLAARPVRPCRRARDRGGEHHPGVCPAPRRADAGDAGVRAVRTRRSSGAGRSIRGWCSSTEIPSMISRMRAGASATSCRERCSRIRSGSASTLGASSTRAVWSRPQRPSFLG
jgi:hypothetical protein